MLRSSEADAKVLVSLGLNDTWTRQAGNPQQFVPVKLGLWPARPYRVSGNRSRLSLPRSPYPGHTCMT